MKHFIWIITIALFVTAGCKNKTANTADNDSNRKEILAGDVQRTWKATKETDAQGDKDRLDRNERDERVVFYRDGKVTMTSNTDASHGTWKLEANTLTLHMDNGEVTRSFEVMELDKNSMRLKAADGSEMKFKPD